MVRTCSVNLDGKARGLNVRDIEEIKHLVYGSQVSSPYDPKGDEHVRRYLQEICKEAMKVKNEINRDAVKAVRKPLLEKVKGELGIPKTKEESIKFTRRLNELYREARKKEVDEEADNLDGEID